MCHMIFPFKSKKIPLNKGWSNDQKFIVSSGKGNALLRVLELSKFERKKAEMGYLFNLDLDVSFSTPLSLKIKKGKVHYTTAYWEGTDLEKVLGQLSLDEQIRLGHQAGRVLRQIHTQVKVDDDGSWEARYSAKIDKKIQSYRSCGLRFDHDETLINRIETLKSELVGRPMTFQHGDYHIGNFLLDPQNNLVILDFDRWDLGDPWEEFNRIVWCREISPLFSSALIEAYFEFQIPRNFFELMFLYIAVNVIGSIAWAQAFGDDEVKVMMGLIERFDQDTDHFTKIVPNWFVSTQAR